MTASKPDVGELWLTVKSKFKEYYIGIILFTYMDFDDFKGKQHLAHTVVPMVYWFSVVYSENFSRLDLNAVALVIGIIFTIIQVVFRYVYQATLKLGESTLEIKSRKLEKDILLFSGIIFAYGFISFLCMLFAQKNVIVWSLIIIYLILVGIIIGMMVYLAIKYPQNLKDFKKFI